MDLFLHIQRGPCAGLICGSPIRAGGWNRRVFGNALQAPRKSIDGVASRTGRVNLGHHHRTRRGLQSPDLVVSQMCKLSDTLQAPGLAQQPSETLC